MKIPSSKNWKELNSYKEQLFLTSFQREILVGGLLGDLNLRKIGKFSRLAVEQKNKDYLFHLYQLFLAFVRTPPKERFQQRLPTSSLKSTWYFSTLSHPDFHEFFTLFYPYGKKILPSNLEHLLTPCSLAYWFMDDGFLSHSSYKFASCSFSSDEHLFLQYILKNKFDISSSFSLRSKYYYLTISKENDSHFKFRDLVSPFIVPSMRYKLGKSF